MRQDAAKEKPRRSGDRADRSTNFQAGPVARRGRFLSRQARNGCEVRSAGGCVNGITKGAT